MGTRLKLLLEVLVMVSSQCVEEVSFLGGDCELSLCFGEFMYLFLVELTVIGSSLSGN